MNIVHVTDPDLIRAGEQLHGLDPQQRFQLCMQSIKQHHSDAYCVVVTGDLADRGEVEAYQLFNEEVAKTGLPVYSIIGNHDDRETCVAQVPQMNTDESGFVQFVTATPAGVFVMLDTLLDGSHSGGFCERRQSWLCDQLTMHRDAPVFLFMHHPPFDLHLPCIDKIGLEQKEEFAAIVNTHANVRHLFFGHAHRPLCGHWKGISFSSLRGTNHQVKLDFESRTNWRGML